MSAADRLARIDELAGDTLCAAAEETLQRLVAIMNEETMLLRAGRLREAAVLTPEKAQVAQDYVVHARAVQRQSERLHQEVPEALARLRSGHESLATQIAENLRVLATARDVAETLLGDVAAAVESTAQPQTYDKSGALGAGPRKTARGIAVDRAL